MCYKSGSVAPCWLREQDQTNKQPLKIFIVNSTHFYTQNCENVSLISSWNLPSWLSWYFTFKCKYDYSNLIMCTVLYKCPEENEMCPPVFSLWAQCLVSTSSCLWSHWLNEFLCEHSYSEWVRSRCLTDVYNRQLDFCLILIPSVFWHFHTKPDFKFSLIHC